MEQARRIINETPNHPLKGLVDPATGDWWGRLHYTAVNEDHPTVQAGHRLSARAGGDTFAVQDALDNQAENWVLESKGGFLDRTGDTIDIGGIPVDKKSAQLWENLDVISKGTVAGAPHVEGWRAGDVLPLPPSASSALTPSMLGIPPWAELGTADAVAEGGLLFGGVGLFGVLGYVLGKKAQELGGELKPQQDRSSSDPRNSRVPEGGSSAGGATLSDDRRTDIERRLDPPTGQFRADAPAEREMDAPIVHDVSGLRKAAREAAQSRAMEWGGTTPPGATLRDAARGAAKERAGSQISNDAIDHPTPGAGLSAVGVQQQVQAGLLLNQQRIQTGLLNQQIIQAGLLRDRQLGGFVPPPATAPPPNQPSLPPQIPISPPMPPSTFSNWVPPPPPAPLPQPAPGGQYVSSNGGPWTYFPPNTP